MSCSTWSSRCFPHIRKLTSVIEAALSNMNAVFHPPGMIMNAGWIEHTNGDFLFYREGFTQAIGRVTAAVDARARRGRQGARRALCDVPRILPQRGSHHQGSARDSATSRARAMRARRMRRSSRRHRSTTAMCMRTSVTASCRWRRSVNWPACRTPTIDALVNLAGLSVGIDYAKDGLTLEKLGSRDNLRPSSRASYTRAHKGSERRWSMKSSPSCAPR